MTPELVRQLYGQGHSDNAIGGMLGVSGDAVFRLRKKHGISRTHTQSSDESLYGGLRAAGVPAGVPLKFEWQADAADALLEIPPRPFAVPIAQTVLPVAMRGTKRAAILPDVHAPFHDERAVAIAEALIRAFGPHYLLQIGDMLDAGKLSTKFPTDPKRIDTLQDDINTARTMLHRWAQLAPNARRVMLEGNHEQRLTRLIWGLEGANRELAKLTAFQQAMTWPNLLGLDQIGWEWVPYEDQPRDDILPHLLVKHGTYVSADAGLTAKREWAATGRSGVSGHTHRAAVYRKRDWNGQATWIEAGCLCDLQRTPGVSSNPNWQQAVTLVEWSEDGALMNVEQVLIRDGRALWRGEEIVA